MYDGLVTMRMRITDSVHHTASGAVRSLLLYAPCPWAGCGTFPPVAPVGGQRSWVCAPMVSDLKMAKRFKLRSQGNGKVGIALRPSAPYNRQ
jgi:hypothetical protein